MATDRERDDDIDRQTGDVLGITRDVTPDETIAEESSEDEGRRRRADDLKADRTTERDPIGGPDSPPGITVRD
jgi:hypothetical protein